MKYLYLCFAVVFCACQTIPTQSIDTTALDSGLSKNVTEISNDKLPVNWGGDGLYFGVSENRFGRRAWLLNIRNGEATLFMPPNNLVIRKVTSGSDGHINFETDIGLGGIIYKFSGLITADRIEGEFNFSSADETRSAKVVLQKIDILSSTKGNLDGLFSSVEFVEEGGDLVGDELIIIPDGNDLVGVFTSYENEMTPYATKIKQSGKKIQFDLVTGNGRQSLEGTFSSKEIRLRYVGANADPSANQMILDRKKDLLDIFTKQ